MASEVVEATLTPEEAEPSEIVVLNLAGLLPLEPIEYCTQGSGGDSSVGQGTRWLRSEVDLPRKHVVCKLHRRRHD